MIASLLRNAAPIALVFALVGSADEELPEVDRPAPMFRLPVYNPSAAGSSFLGLDRYVGSEAPEKGARLVLISFMASHCAPCKKEMPYLESLHRKYKEQGLRILSVSIDTEPEGQKKIDELIRTNQITYPVLKDRFNLVARRWLGNQTALPSLFLVRADGTVSQVHRGYSQELSNLLHQEVELALGVKPAATERAATASAGKP